MCPATIDWYALSTSFLGFTPCHQGRSLYPACVDHVNSCSVHNYCICMHIIVYTILHAPPSHMCTHMHTHTHTHTHKHTHTHTNVQTHASPPFLHTHIICTASTSPNTHLHTLTCTPLPLTHTHTRTHHTQTTHTHTHTHVQPSFMRAQRR